MSISEKNKIVLTQMKIAGNGTYLRVTPDAMTVPDAAKKLLLAPNADSLRDALINLSDKVSDETLSGESSLAKDKGYYKLHNWASGGAPFRRFKEDELTDFFEELFTTLVAVSLSLTTGNSPWWQGAPVQLSRADLFHGHLIWDTSVPFADLLFLFHAKEYPSDIESTKAGFARHLESGVYKDFKTSSADFKYRCSIYSLRLNRLYILKLSDNGSPYRGFVANPDLSKTYNPLRIDQDDLGECVADVNHFPNDGVRLFFCTRPSSK